MRPAPVTRVGLQIAGYSFAHTADEALFARVADTAGAAERFGFDSLWTMDHVHQINTVGDREEPILEAYTTLAALAAVTKSANLGVLVTACGFRSPALLAKMVTTIDVISGGRALLGIGAGWHEEEFGAYGIPFPPARDRLAALAEAVRVCRAMFTEHAPSFTGVHHRVDGALNYPSPIRPTGPPILIGGGGEKTLIPTVAAYGDACNFFGAPATVRHKIDVLERACERLGRDPGEITRTWLGTAIVTDSEVELQEQLERLARLFSMSPRAVRGFAVAGTPDQVAEQVGRYRDVGVDGVIVNVLDLADVDHVCRVGTVLAGAMNG